MLPKAHASILVDASSTGPSIDDLPPELLRLIFATAQEELPYVHVPGSLLSVVSLVSRYWYDVAMGTPSRYPTIKLSPSLSLDVMRLRLERWKDRSTCLELLLPAEEASEGWADEYCSLLIPHVLCCRRISIRHDSSSHTPMLKVLLR